MADSKKKSRKERQRELRMLEKDISGGKSVIDYGKVNERHMDDKRFERELKHKEVLQKQADHGASKESEQAPSATYDAFMRMQTGQETRTIADKINDPNRVSWEQFRKDNADKLDIPGADRKKMVEYRAQLDKERESALAKGRNRPKRKVRTSSKHESRLDADDTGGSDSEEGVGTHARVEMGYSPRGEKAWLVVTPGLSRRRGNADDTRGLCGRRGSWGRGGDESDDSSDSDTDGESEESKRRHRKKDKKSRKKESKEPEPKGADPRRLSAFLQGSGSESE
ncbi:unnamed protein product [Scytosiphon promiscuus]